MPVLNRANVDLNYEVVEPVGMEIGIVTLVNGYTRPLNDFRMLAKKISEMGFRVVLLDNRGAGKTIAHAPFTLHDMVQDIIGIVDHLEVDEFHVLGISMGGMIAQQLTHGNINRVTSLTLISTAGSPVFLPDGEDPWSEDYDAVYEKMSRYFTDRFLQNNRVIVSAMVKQIVKNVKEGNFVEDAARQRLAIQGFDSSEYLHEISTRTLIVHGKEDLIIPLDSAHHLRDKIPNAEIVEVENAGHLLLAEAPQTLYQSVENFLVQS